MNSGKIWERFFECDCHGEGIMISAEYFDDIPDYPIIDLAYWNEGYNGKTLSFWLRIKYAWRVLRTGKPWHDMVMVNKNTAKELGEYLISFSKK